MCVYVGRFVHIKAFPDTKLEFFAAFWLKPPRDTIGMEVFAELQQIYVKSIF